jgi:hypothetical protein
MLNEKAKFLKGISQRGGIELTVEFDYDRFVKDVLDLIQKEVSKSRRRGHHESSTFRCLRAVNWLISHEDGVGRSKYFFKTMRLHPQIFDELEDDYSIETMNLSNWSVDQIQDLIEKLGMANLSNEELINSMTEVWFNIATSHTIGDVKKMSTETRAKLNALKSELEENNR